MQIKALIIFTIVVFFILFALLGNQIFVSDNISNTVLVAVFFAFGFIIVNLFILKNKGVELAGNVLAVGLVMIELATLNFFGDGVSILSKYIQGFYLILALLVVGALFASTKVFIFNSIIIFITTTRVFNYGLESESEIADILTAGYVYQTLSLVIITVIIYFVIDFATKAIDAA
ncbi:MAG: hypothetical protein KAI79_08120, partial [Bacteroidales bacterium]|nr:hypothetical protein [Bacteroidales bacterium]